MNIAAQLFNLRILGDGEKYRGRLCGAPGVENLVVGIEQGPVFRQRRGAFQHAHIAEDHLLITTWLNVGFSLLRQPPAGIIVLDHQLLLSADAFVASPPGNIKEMPVALVTNTCQAGKGTVLA